MSKIHTFAIPTNRKQGKLSTNFSFQDFLTLRGLVTTPAGQNFASKLQQIKFQACHPSHLAKAAELLEQATGLETFILEHLQIPQAHHHVVK